MSIPPFLLDKTPWEKALDPIWSASTLTLHRNLLRFDFPSKLTNQEAEQMLTLLKTTLQTLPEIEVPLYLKAPEISNIDKEFLFEHFLLLEGFSETLDGEAFMIDSTADLLILLNIKDHVQIHTMDVTCDLKKSYERLARIESSLGSALDFAFNAQFGYLTSDPGLSGTGLIANTYLHVPALVHQGELRNVLSTALEENTTASGLNGALDGLTGDLLILSNLYTLGNSEETILRSLEASTRKIITLERDLRSHLRNTPSHTIKDEVARAFGLLMNSHQMGTEEALSALSLLKLGVDLKWVEGVSEKDLNELLFRCRKAHLSLAHQDSPKDDLSLALLRSTFIKDHLKTLHLTI